MPLGNLSHQHSLFCVADLQNFGSGVIFVSIARKVGRGAGVALLWGGAVVFAIIGLTPPINSPASAQVQRPSPDLSSGPLPPERSNQPNPIAEDYQVGALQPDYTGSLWVGSHQGLVRIDPETGRILARVAVPNRFIDAMAQDNVGRILLGTPEGLVRVEPRLNEVTAQNFRLPSNRVLATLVDRRGFLWVGTDRGLAMVSPDEGLLMTTLQVLPGVSANTLGLAPDGNLWVGTLEGLVRVNTATAYVTDQVNNLPGRSVQAIATGPQGELWVGTPTGSISIK